jgi:gliding motility-associated ABC transporter ATP-binding subunit GldA
MSIEVRNITKLYGEQKALDDVSFTVKTGEVIGFLGPNGAGKSTLMKTLVGVIRPNSGVALINGIDVSIDPFAIKRITGYLPEHNPLYTDMYVTEFLTFIGNIHQVKNLPQRISELIDLTGLGMEKHKKISMLSKGYRQRVGLAQALIHDPAVLILDEPTTGLDPNQIVDIRNLIKEVGKTKTVMLSTHIMQEVEAVCSKVVIISKGKIVANENQDYLKLHARGGSSSVFVEFLEPVDASFFSGIQSILRIDPAGEKGWVVLVEKEKDPRAIIFKKAVEQGFTIITLHTQEKHLEDVFHDLTTNDNQ